MLQNPKVAEGCNMKQIYYSNKLKNNFTQIKIVIM
jgi:hypothetical protein